MLLLFLLLSTSSSAKVAIGVDEILRTSIPPNSVSLANFISSSIALNRQTANSSASISA